MLVQVLARELVHVHELVQLLAQVLARASDTDPGPTIDPWGRLEQLGISPTMIPGTHTPLRFNPVPSLHNSLPLLPPSWQRQIRPSGSWPGQRNGAVGAVTRMDKVSAPVAQIGNVAEPPYNYIRAIAVSPLACSFSFFIEKEGHFSLLITFFFDNAVQVGYRPHHPRRLRRGPG